MTALTVSGLTVGFGPVEVLRGVDLHVPAGATAAVLGPSGCGKTTLLRAIAGFAPSSAGTITVGERVLVGPRTWLKPEERGVGLVPQEGALFPHLDVAGNVGFGLPRAQRRRSARIGEALELVGLAGFERRSVAELSGGQQQRVALARALAPEPGVILLDEPFSALDAGLRDSVRHHVREALDAAAATAVLVTHDQDEALSFADTVAVLIDGRVAMQGTPHEVYDRPSDLEVARFVGQALDWPVLSQSGTAISPVGEVAVTRADGQVAHGPGRLMLRPEQLVLVEHGVEAEVVATTYFGHDWLARLRLPLGDEVVLRGSGTPVTGTVRVGVRGLGVFYPDRLSEN